MDTVWTTAAFTFFAAATATFALVYAFSGSSPILTRLTRLWAPVAAEQPPGIVEKQKQFAGRMLTDLGRHIPTSAKKLSHTRRLLVRAGFRSPEVALAMRAMQLITPAALLGVVYFTRVYTVNPAFIFGFTALAGFMLPEIWLTWRVKRRQHRIRLALPDALDLLVVCVEAGLGLDQAILRVAQELGIAHPELSDEFQIVNLEMRVGKSRIEALRELAQRTGVDDVKSLVAMLVQTDRFGTSVAQSLRVHSDNLRIRRRQRAEEMAAKTTVKMIPPLVFCIFPALFVVILGPAIINMVRQLLPMMNR